MIFQIFGSVHWDFETEVLRVSASVGSRLKTPILLFNPCKSETAEDAEGAGKAVPLRPLRPLRFICHCFFFAPSSAR